MKKLRKYVPLILIAGIVGPVVIAQLIPEEVRRFETVTLPETEYTEVTFTNDLQGLELAGLLFEPQGTGPFPGVVVIHGSGTSRRGNGWYLSLVTYLQTNGIAVRL